VHNAAPQPHIVHVPLREIETKKAKKKERKKKQLPKGRQG
jgi:hypothetical protein